MIELAPEPLPLKETERVLVRDLSALALFALTHFIKDIFWVPKLREPGKSNRRVNGLYSERKHGNFIYLDYSLDQDTASKVLVHESIHGFIYVGNRKIAINTEENAAYAIEDFLWARLTPGEKAMFRSYLPSRLHCLKKPR